VRSTHKHARLCGDEHRGKMIVLPYPKQARCKGPGDVAVADNLTCQ
jgi:hypothetical protein